MEELKGTWLNAAAMKIQQFEDIIIHFLIELQISPDQQTHQI